MSALLRALRTVAGARGLGGSLREAISSRAGMIGAGALGVGGAMMASDAARADDGNGDTLAAQRARVRQLQEEQQQITRMIQESETNPEALMALQRRVGTNPDGRYGGATGDRVNAERSRIEANLAAEQQRLATLELQQRFQAHSDNGMGGLVAPLAGVAIGALLGHGGRHIAAALVKGGLTHRARNAARLIAQASARGPIAGTSRAAMAAREGMAADLKEFWRMGGAGEPPPPSSIFQYASQRRPLGGVPYTASGGARNFKRNPRAADATSLFPPDGPPNYRLYDVGMFGAGVGESMFSESNLENARTELEEARADVAKTPDPSDVQLDRLKKAQDAVNLWTFGVRAGQGLALGAGVSPLFHAYPRVRPDVASRQADELRMALDRALTIRRRRR